MSKAVVAAIGAPAQGRRGIRPRKREDAPGLDVADSEEEVFWRGFLTGVHENSTARQGPSRGTQTEK